MAPLSERVEKRIEWLFSPDDRERVRTILVEECGENVPGWRMADLERLRIAVLKLSGGKVDKLRIAVDTAKIDFRDVLMAAGFGDGESYKSWVP
jgi:hypothetical protein